MSRLYFSGVVSIIFRVIFIIIIDKIVLNTTILYIHMYICMYIHIYTFYLCMSTYTYIYMYAHIYIYVYIHGGGTEDYLPSSHGPWLIRDTCQGFYPGFREGNYVFFRRWYECIYMHIYVYACAYLWWLPMIYTRALSVSYFASGALVVRNPSIRSVGHSLRSVLSGRRSLARRGLLRRICKGLYLWGPK